MSLLDAIINKYGQAIPTGGKGWYLLPECPNCGKPKHFAFHPALGFICHKCQFSGGSHQLRKLAGMSTAAELSWHDQEKPEAPKLAPNTFPIPPNSTPYPSPPGYFTIKRQIPTEAFSGLKLYRGAFDPLHPEMSFDGYCLFGLQSLIGTSFFGYAMRESLRRSVKTKYPTGDSTSRYLFLFDVALKEHPRTVVICEGAIDALRLRSHQQQNRWLPFPLALLGKSLSNDRILALARLSCDRYYIVLDQDTERPETSMDYPAEMRHDLGAILGHDRVKLIRLSGLGRSDLDPDQVRDIKDWEYLVREAE